MRHEWTVFFLFSALISTPLAYAKKCPSMDNVSAGVYENKAQFVLNKYLTTLENKPGGKSKIYIILPDPVAREEAIKQHKVLNHPENLYPKSVYSGNSKIIEIPLIDDNKHDVQQILPILSVKKNNTQKTPQQIALEENLKKISALEEVQIYNPGLPVFFIPYSANSKATIKYKDDFNAAAADDRRADNGCTIANLNGLETLSVVHGNTATWATKIADINRNNNNDPDKLSANEKSLLIESYEKIKIKLGAIEKGPTRGPASGGATAKVKNFQNDNENTGGKSATGASKKSGAPSTTQKTAGGG